MSTVSRHGARAVAIIAAAVLPCLGLAANAGLAGAVTIHPDSRAVVVAHHVPHLSAPKVLHEPDAFHLYGVSCVSTKHCVAVGYAAGLGSKGLDGAVLVPITKGKLGKPLISHDPASAYYGVSCITATRCVVAGQGKPTAKSNEVAELLLWHHGKLSLIRRTTATPETSSMFRAVDCWTATSCTAVGNATATVKGSPHQPIAIFGDASLKGSPSAHVVLNDVSGYAASIACPTSRSCYIGGATAAGGAELVRSYRGSKGYDLHGAAQPSFSGLEGIACVSVHSCEGAGVEDLPSFQYQGWLEHLKGFVTGTPHEVTGTQQLFAIATINRSYYLSVGYYGGANWATDLVSASGKAAAMHGDTEGGYLQAVTCPAPTECVAVGFTTDSHSKQPGGENGVDGAVAIFHLKLS
jgi:hypothetical protein